MRGDAACKSTAVDTDPRGEFNLKLEPAIKAGSGVKATIVDSAHAAACAAFLQQQWRGSARLGLTGIYLGGTQCQGYASYPKTLLVHDAEEQASHTLLISSALLPLYREKCPGFEAMEQQLVAWLAEEFGVVAELANGHVLRQSQATLRSTGFGVHQDTEDDDSILFTVVVKLTADEDEEPPSAMRVLAAGFDFEYAPQAGAAGCFLAAHFHQSIAPASEREHLKLAFFFRQMRRQRGAAKALGAQWQQPVQPALRQFEELFYQARAEERGPKAPDDPLQRVCQTCHYRRCCQVGMPRHLPFLGDGHAAMARAAAAVAGVDAEELAAQLAHYHRPGAPDAPLGEGEQGGVDARGRRSSNPRSGTAGASALGRALAELQRGAHSGVGRSGGGSKHGGGGGGGGPSNAMALKGLGPALSPAERAEVERVEADALAALRLRVRAECQRSSAAKDSGGGGGGGAAPLQAYGVGRLTGVHAHDPALASDVAKARAAEVVSAAAAAAARDAAAAAAACTVCGSGEDEPGRNDILLCDACGGGFHTRCLQPPLDAVPPGDWFCAGCARQRRKSAVYQARARAERKSRGGPNGRRPKQQNGWLIDMHGEITGACYACKVLRCTAIYSGVGSSRVIAQWFTPLHCAGDCGRQGRWRHCPASRSPSARGACAQPRSYTSTRAYHKLDRTATMGACI